MTTPFHPICSTSVAVRIRCFEPHIQPRTIQSAGPGRMSISLHGPHCRAAPRAFVISCLPLEFEVTEVEVEVDVDDLILLFGF